ncbi:hypothetical protein AVEN_54589-1 [Araneus ventricosus]|uniref:Uncharacterized protein n=1 Tax=Araneus ventricosus TaxID=182803 RepID=A0A4Y2BNT8_ARAVE|nr:hypothetical protein AVEN_54589-1 [Araneus ventricosus]
MMSDWKRWLGRRLQHDSSSGILENADVDFIWHGQVMRTGKMVRRRQQYIWSSASRYVFDFDLHKKTVLAHSQNFDHHHPYLYSCGKANGGGYLPQNHNLGSEIGPILHQQLGSNSIRNYFQRGKDFFQNFN